MTPALEAALARIGDAPKKPNRSAPEEDWAMYYRAGRNYYKAQRDALLVFVRERRGWAKAFKADSVVAEADEVLKRCSDE